MSEDTLLEVMADNEIRDKQNALAISREAFLANPEAIEAMKELGIDPAQFREHLRTVERKHLLDEALRKDQSKTLGREISPEEWAAHKKERRETLLTRRTPIYETDQEREEREYVEEMAAHDRLVAEEERLQAIIDAAGPESEDPEVGVAREKLEAIDKAIEEGATVTQLLNLLED